MEKFIPVLKKSQLFSGVGEGDISAMLSCLNAKLGKYKKGEYVYRQGQHIDQIAVLAEGELHMQRDDYWGNRSIINRIAVGEMFGEAYLAPESSLVINDLIAASDCTVIFFDAKRVITTCSHACRFHSMVVQNLFFAISEKNRGLVQKLGHMSQRSTREKLI
ncbi:MAG: cyclic nucleotide-binding domain-containing protein, partial [Oscillospiraceae bacterium]|nr:cyclic nucleotide-binding domain-containing protein [Oscillospiraceae bacterium]